MELVVVARCQVDDAVVELVELVRQQVLVVGEVVRLHHVLVGARKQRLERAEEADERVADAFHLFHHSVRHLAAVKDLAVSRAGLNTHTTSRSTQRPHITKSCYYALA